MGTKKKRGHKLKKLALPSGSLPLPDSQGPSASMDIKTAPKYQKESKKLQNIMTGPEGSYRAESRYEGLNFKLQMDILWVSQTNPHLQNPREKNFSFLFLSIYSV